MPAIKNRIIAGSLGLVLALGLTACSADEDTPNPSPDGTNTTEPVGS